MNISWNIDLAKNIVSHSSHPIPLHPTQSHHCCFNVWTYCVYFWYRNNNEPKKMPGVDGRGLGWTRWDPSHSNPTPIPPGPIVQNCLCLNEWMKIHWAKSILIYERHFMRSKICIKALLKFNNSLCGTTSCQYGSRVFIIFASTWILLYILGYWIMDIWNGIFHKLGYWIFRIKQPNSICLSKKLFQGCTGKWLNGTDM